MVEILVTKLDCTMLGMIVYSFCGIVRTVYFFNFPKLSALLQKPPDPSTLPLHSARPSLEPSLR